MRTSRTGRIGSPAAVLWGILLVAGALLGSCHAVAVAPASLAAATSTAPDGHDPACAHMVPTAEVAVTDPMRRGDGAGTDGMIAIPGVPGLAPSAAGFRAAPATGTRGPPVAGRALLESLGIARI